MDKQIKKMLYRSFDEELNSEDEKKLQEALANSDELRKEQKQILELRKMVAGTKADSFKPFFAEKVMQKIQRRSESENIPESFFDSLIATFKPVAVGVAILLIILMSYNLKKSGNLSFASAFAEPEVTLEDVLDPSLTFTLEWE